MLAFPPFRHVRRTVHATCIFVLASGGSVLACGGRTQLSVGSAQDGGEVQTDAGPASDAPIVDAQIVDAQEDEGDVDDSSDSESGGPAPTEAGTILSCATCLSAQCGPDISQCLTSASCLSTLQCAATSCFAGTTPNVACVLGCANGDISSLLSLEKIFACVTNTCPDCGGLLGQLTGTGGGPDG